MSDTALPRNPGFTPVQRAALRILAEAGPLHRKAMWRRIDAELGPRERIRVPNSPWTLEDKEFGDLVGDGMVWEHLVRVPGGKRHEHYEITDKGRAALASGRAPVPVHIPAVHHV